MVWNLLETQKKEGPDDRRIKIMRQGQDALKDKEFIKAKLLFQGLSGVPKGPITDWPHLTLEELTPYPKKLVPPEFHLPTTHDVLLGLGLAAMGMGEVKTAEFYIKRSGYYLISPTNLAERRETGRWIGAAYEPQGNPLKTKWMDEFKIRGYEGMVTNGHSEWIDPAAIALVDKMHEWIYYDYRLESHEEGFSLLEKLYGIGRPAPEELRMKVRHYPKEFYGGSRYRLAVLYLKEYIRFETPYVFAISQDMAYLAKEAAQKGFFDEAEFILNEILTLEPSSEITLTEDELGGLHSSRKEEAWNLCLDMAEAANRQKQADLARKYQELHATLKSSA